QGDDRGRPAGVRRTGRHAGRGHEDRGTACPGPADAPPADRPGAAVLRGHAGGGDRGRPRMLGGDGAQHGPPVPGPAAQERTGTGGVPRPEGVHGGGDGMRSEELIKETMRQWAEEAEVPGDLASRALKGGKRVRMLTAAALAGAVAVVMAGVSLVVPSLLHAERGIAVNPEPTVNVN